VPSVRDVAAKRTAVVIDRVREALAAAGGPPSSPVVDQLVKEGHAPEAIAAAIVACYAPVPPPADDREEPLDAPSHRPPPGRPFGNGPGGNGPGGKRPFAKRPYGKKPGPGGPYPPRGGEGGPPAGGYAGGDDGPRPPGKPSRKFGPVAGGGDGPPRAPWGKKPFPKKKTWKKKKPGPG
jgi:hypothetical protein